jgi:hypothetical protein
MVYQSTAADAFESNVGAIKKNFPLINNPQPSHPSLGIADG